MLPSGFEIPNEAYQKHKFLYLLTCIMEKICWANTDNFDEAEFVVVGIPDESQ